MHALIVEDEVLLAWLIEHMLKAMGFTSCDIAATQNAAIKAATARDPDLITADVWLAEGTGIAAVKEICRDRPIPVVYVTGNADALCNDRQAIVVDKPVREGRLSEAVAEALRTP